MEHTFTFTDDELSTLKYTICQRMYRLEAVIEEEKFLDPENSTVSRLEDTLLTLEAIHMMMFKGGEQQ